MTVDLQTVPATTTLTDVDPRALVRLRDEIQRDIDAGSYDGVRIILARHGEVVLNETLGFAERATGRTLEPDAVFRVLSLTKAFTNAMSYRALGEGKLALSTRVVDLIPEFPAPTRSTCCARTRSTSSTS